MNKLSFNQSKGNSFKMSLSNSKFRGLQSTQLWCNLFNLTTMKSWMAEISLLPPKLVSSRKTQIVTYSFQKKQRRSRGSKNRATTLPIEEVLNKVAIHLLWVDKHQIVLPPIREYLSNRRTLRILTYEYWKINMLEITNLTLKMCQISCFRLIRKMKTRRRSIRKRVGKIQIIFTI